MSSEYRVVSLARKTAERERKIDRAREAYRKSTQRKDGRSVPRAELVVLAGRERSPRRVALAEMSKPCHHGPQ